MKRKKNLFIHRKLWPNQADNSTATMRRNSTFSTCNRASEDERNEWI